MNRIRVRTVKDDETFFDNPDFDLIEKMLREPAKFANEDELGSISISCRSEDHASDLSFFLGVSNEAVLIYSSDLEESAFISIGDISRTEEILVKEDYDGERFLEGRNFIAIEKAIMFARQFFEVGQIEIGGESWELSHL